MTDIETGLRWGELIALRPRHIDFLHRAISVEQTIVEVSRKHSPTGQRMIVKNYPKDNEFRTLRVSDTLLKGIAQQIKQLGLGRDDLIFSSTNTAGGNPIVGPVSVGRPGTQSPHRAGLEADHQEALERSRSFAGRGRGGARLEPGRAHQSDRSFGPGGVRRGCRDP